VAWTWGPAVAQMLVIFAASSIPNLTSLPGGLSDHAGHFIGYAILGALALRAVAGGRWDHVTLSAAWRAWALTAVYGATDEFHQRFVLGRTPDVVDWVADALGALAAIALITGAAMGTRAESGEV
jgi:VanZ family protein